MSTARKLALDIVDDAFAKAWNTHTSVQMDNNVRDVLYEIVTRLFENQSQKKAAPKKKAAAKKTKRKSK